MNNTDLVTLNDSVGGRYITRGYESVDMSGGPSDPFLRRPFQIINNTVAFLPDSNVVVDDRPKKKWVFRNTEWKVLLPEGLRPMTKNAPGTSIHKNELADVLGRYGWSVDQWETIYETCVNRHGFDFAGIRAAVTDKQVHAYRTLYGIRCQNKGMAYHISGVFNSLVYTIIQLSAFSRLGLEPTNFKSGVRLTSLRSAPMSDVDEIIADVQEEIELTIKDDDTPFEERMETVSELQHERELRVCRAYGLLEDGEEELPEALIEKAEAWRSVIKRFIGL